MSSENKSVWNTLNKTEDWKIPAHIAIIMDGNGRWAKKRGMPRTFGHTQGAKVVEQILEDADALGVRYLTVYAFSTENWSRPAAEVKALMNLLRRYMKTSLAKCAKNNVRIRVIGDKSMLEKDLQEAIANLEKETASNTGISFQIAINYGGRDEIVRAVRRAAEAGLLNDPGKLWQIAYSEMYFTPKAWPEFDRDELIRAIDAYNHRERRYGGLGS